MKQLKVVARINVTKPWRKRRLKNDAEHRADRLEYRREMRNPQERRKLALYLTKYLRKNRQALKRRQEFVRRAKERMP